MKTLVQSPAALGRALRDARRKKSLTQHQLAVMAGLAQTTVSIVERGARGATLNTMMRLLAALDLELVLQSRQSADLTAQWQKVP